jgi:tRNA threonylcarbamoyladenosine biosynthesis protein TsaB
VRYREDLAGHTLIDIADRHHAYPSVHNLAIIAMRRALREQWSSPTDIRAMYLRAPDAEINWSTRDSSPPAVVQP